MTPVKRFNDPVYRHRLAQFLADAVIAALAFFLAFQLRFLDEAGGIPSRYWTVLWGSIGFIALGKAVIFTAFGLNNKWWRYFYLRDFPEILRAVAVASAVLVVVFTVAQPFPADLPRSVMVMDFLICLLGVFGGRMVARFLAERPARTGRRKDRDSLIVGAGSGGQMVVREMLLNPNLGSKAIGFIDDDPRKRGMRLLGLKVLGSTDEIGRVLDEHKPNEVVVAIPSAPGVLRGRVVTACREREIRVRTLPTVFELLRGGVQLTRQLREVQVEDVLGRDPVVMELDRVGAYLTDRIVLVTGAGGSIGSELSRQIARVRPRLLILLDHAEDNLFAIDREMLDEWHFSAVEAVLADCRERDRMLRGDAALQARDRVPRRRLQARAADGVQPARGGAQQRDRNAGHGRDGRRGRHGAVRARLDRQGRQPSHCHGRLQGDGRVGDRRRGSPSFDDSLPHGPVRQRPRVVGERRPDLPRPDRARGPGDRDRSRDDPLLHDDSRVGPARDPGGRSRRTVGRRVRARDGRARADHRPCPQHDQARGLRARAGHGDRDHRPATRGEAHEELFNVDERSEPTEASRIVRAVRERPLDPDWVERTVTDLERLVAAGDETGLAQRVVGLVAEQRRARRSSDGWKPERRSERTLRCAHRSWT